MYYILSTVHEDPIKTALGSQVTLIARAKRKSRYVRALRAEEINVAEY